MIPKNTGRGTGTTNRGGKAVKKECVITVSLWAHSIALGTSGSLGPKYSQNVVPEPANSASPVNVLEMQVHSLHSDLLS